MANFPIGDQIRSYMMHRCQLLTARRRQYAEDGFPLSVEQIQRAIMHPRESTLLQRMLDDGLTILDHAKDGQVSVLLDCVELGTSRSAVATIDLPARVFVPRSNGWWLGQGAHPMLATQTLLRLELSRLEADARTALARWTDNAVRERRLEVLVNSTVKVMLEHQLHTVYHATVRWPAVAALVPQDETKWRARFAEKPRSARAYDWSAGPRYYPGCHHRPSTKALQAAEMVIASASMLPKLEHAPGTIIAHLEAWQPRPTDPDYILPC